MRLCSAAAEERASRNGSLAAAGGRHPRQRVQWVPAPRTQQTSRLQPCCSSPPTRQGLGGRTQQPQAPPPQQPQQQAKLGNGRPQQQEVAPASPSMTRPDDADVLIEFRDVHKSFGSKAILRGASFKIRRGEAVGIIGSSGTGKSTTLRLAAGLLAPDRGEVLIKGEPRQGLISDDDTSNKLKVGLVFQSGALFDSLTVGENVGFLLHEHTSLPEARVKELVAESLGKVGLSGVEALYPSELSGGMKKRVALARAIVQDDSHDDVEQVIMYDEPTAGLDPVASTVVEDLIRGLHAKYGSHHATSSSNGRSSSTSGAPTQQQFQDQPGGITSYVVVTHQHSTIRRAVDRLIFLHEGRVVWEGSTAEFDTTDEPIVRQFASGSLQGPIVYV